MGVIKQGILGGVSGKVANVVGSSWKGIAYLKALPLSVANPKTAGQLLQRGKMREIVADSRLLLAALLQPFWNPFAQRQSGYNAYVSENIAQYDIDSLATPAGLFASRGTLLGTPDAASVEGATDDDIVITWTDNAGEADALGTDEMHMLVWNETSDTWFFFNNIGIRSDAAGAAAMTGTSVADVIHTWVFPARPDISKTSDSVYTTYNVA